MDSERLKPVRWIGSSRRDVRSFPPAVRLEIATLSMPLRRAKRTRRPNLKGFGGRRVIEIVSDHRGDAWRSVYTVRFEGAVYAPFRASASNGSSRRARWAARHTHRNTLRHRRAHSRGSDERAGGCRTGARGRPILGDPARLNPLPPEGTRSIPAAHCARWRGDSPFVFNKFDFL
jgi:hypothetical protein